MYSVGQASFLCQSSMKFKEKKMPSMFRWKTKNGNEEKPLMKNIEQTDGKTLSCYFSIIDIYESNHLCICRKANILPLVHNASILFKVLQQFVWCHGLMNHIWV